MRAALTLLRFIGWTLLLGPVQFLLLVVGAGAAARLPLVYHRGVCRILGIKVATYGKQSAARPALFACNHTSYLDIVVLGSLIEGSFVAKAEVRGWPLFGWLARLQRTVFVERRISRTKEQSAAMRRRLETGERLILFPEGTSSDGNRVLPFKSTFFALAEDAVRGEWLTVQPVSIAYTKLDDMPMGRFYRPYYAWYGDMDLAAHLWTMMGLGRATVEVEYHEPVTIERFGSRKALAAHCQAAVARGVATALAGRTMPPRRRRFLRRRSRLAANHGEASSA